jgi:hypothetical protein
MRERQKHSGEKESQNNEDKWVRKGKLTEKKRVYGVFIGENLLL